MKTPKIKLISPTLHLYYYVLSHGMNEDSQTRQERRTTFTENLDKITSHLTSETGKNAQQFVKLVPLDSNFSSLPSKSILDFSQVPSECILSDDGLIKLKTGIIDSFLGIFLLNDSYLLRLTRYIDTEEGEQSLNTFSNLSEYINELRLELGQTAILAGILPDETTSEENDLIATYCLNQYYQQTIDPEKIIIDEFLGCPFYICPQKIQVKQPNDYLVNSVKLACVFLYKNEDTERKADDIYPILQDLLLSYHKITFFYAQSRILKSRLEQQYKDIECLTEKYTKQDWNSQSLKQIPLDSLYYYQRLTFLKDQKNSVEVNLKNYRKCLKNIKIITDHTPPNFFTAFQSKIEFYLEQMKTDIGFLSPALRLYDKLMLSVQTQISIDEAKRQENKSKKEAQLGLIFTAIGTTLAMVRLLTDPLIKTSSSFLEPTAEMPSLKSIWLGTSLTILLTFVVAYVIGYMAYEWLNKSQ
ncbi:MAG: hypothetical protein QNJ42_02725 [Crocosphaera sp.]|nr:hypothetical protein [Crocosphaera sp.]